jgi:predicted enzyme related to lactoylglutathione lyase
MSERERYPAGVPCWVETLQPDPRAALDFYGPLFGWEFAGPGPMPGDPPGEYYVARVRGRVDSADEAAARATDAGGCLLGGPLDVPPVGRLAVLTDRRARSSRCGRRGRARARSSSTRPGRGR